MTAAPLAIVTGGKRRLGAEIAAKLAEAGYALALVSHLDKEPDNALLAAIELHDLPPPGCTVSIGVACPASLSDPTRSEARNVMIRWRALTPAEQQDVINFLKTL